MKCRVKIIALLLTVAIAAGALSFIAGCKKKGEEVIKIGAILPLTGDGAKYGEAAKEGIELALQEINNKNGIRGKKIQIIYEDSQGIPSIGVSAAQKLINVDKIQIIIGDLFSSVTLAIAPIANENKVILFSPASSSPKLTNAGDYIFRNCASDIFEGEIMGKFVTEKLKLKKIAILYINNDYGIGIADVFRSIVTKNGITISSDEAFEQNSNDFKPQLLKIKNLNPDAIYIVGYKELGYLLKQAKETGIKKQFLSTVMFEDQDIIKIAGDAAEGTIYSYRTYDTESKDNNLVSFVNSFKSNYNSIPDIFSALSYDALNIIFQAIQTSGYNIEEIKNALYNIKHYPGITGDTTFDENGDVIQPAQIKIVKNGNFIKYISN